MHKCISYPMGRRQKVVVEGKTFGPINVSGIPQALVLDLLLFIIYIDSINDKLSVDS